MENIMSKGSKGISVFLVLFLITISACKASISRNDDGTITVDTTITQQQLQDVITASIAEGDLATLKTLTDANNNNALTITVTDTSAAAADLIKVPNPPQNSHFAYSMIRCLRMIMMMSPSCSCLVLTI